MIDTAISVNKISKQYRIGKHIERYRTLRESLANSAAASARHIRSRLTRSRSASSKSTIWALQDISFEVGHGEVLGVIGPNGSGKTTLLKILSRITEPTSGWAEIRGRVGSLLEVGTGFHPELTGRENIYLNGAILGMSRHQIEHRFDEIVSFAEVEKFVDTPVKRYSSGMQMRLAFSVAAHLEPEILLVDEVLAVGDLSFQRKCMGKMTEVANEGRTVLFVSHSMPAVSQLCDRVLVLMNGRITYDGDTNSAINLYTRSIDEGQDVIDTSASSRRSGTGEGRIVQVRLRGSEGGTASFGIGEPFKVHIVIDLQDRISQLVAGFELTSLDGNRMLNVRSDSQGLTFGPYPNNQVVTLTISVPGLPLYPGTYLIHPWFASRGGKRLDHLEEGIKINLVSQGLLESEGLIQARRGVILIDCSWEAHESTERLGDHPPFLPSQATSK
jgi:lipopolysaccharide transport system ATP-binding protein